MSEYITLATDNENDRNENLDVDGDVDYNLINEDEDEDDVVLDFEKDTDFQSKSFDESSDDEYDSAKLLGYNKKRRDEKKSKLLFIYLIIFYTIWAIFYMISLKGGDMYFIQANLVSLGVKITISFISYSINLWIIAFMPIPKRTKALLYLIHIMSIILFLLYDHGELFDNHGMYNFILFCVYFVVLDGIALILYIWYKVAGNKKFIIQFFFFIMVLVILVAINLKKYYDIWIYGFLDKKIEDGEGLCKVRRPLPWFDLLPRGAQNFWTGSQSCSREEYFDAFFDPTQSNKLVVRDCPKNEKITYMILPETRFFTLSEKAKIKYSVVDKMMAVVYNYTEPVELNNVEAVYVSCGEKQSKLVTKLGDRRVDPVEGEQPIEKLNVLLMYFDAVSRRQFLRSLPKTVKKIESIQATGITHLNQFFRYGVVGYNTLKNSLGLFAGRQWKADEVGVPIWEIYKKRGYVAGLADDMCEDWDNAYNNRTATSYDHEFLAPFCLPEYHERNGSPWGNFKGPFSLRRRCITGQYVHNYALNYTKQFIKLYDGTNPWFFRSSYIEGHESTAEVLNLMDDDLFNFFDSLSEETLSRTAIIMMSDHGLHMGFSYLFSNQGRTEHKLPFLTTLIPERFLDKYPELRKNLDENEQKLISAFDVYATLRDILDFDPAREPKEKVGGGIDISEAKITDRIIGRRKRNNLLNHWDEEKDKLFKKEKRKDVQLDENLNQENNQTTQLKENEVQIINNGVGIKNATIVWGKSLLRKVPYNRKCEEILIHKEHCVCH